MKLLAAVALLSVALAFTSSPNPDAPTGFDNKSNGMVDDATHQADQAKFDDIETVATALGRFITPKPAESATRTRRQVEPARSRSCA